eukprot:g4126.t1
MSKRRIIVGNDKKPVQQVMSPSFTQLLDGLLRFKPEDRLVLLEAQPGLSSSSVWAQPWLRQARFSL